MVIFVILVVSQVSLDLFYHLVKIDMYGQRWEETKIRMPLQTLAIFLSHAEDTIRESWEKRSDPVYEIHDTNVHFQMLTMFVNRLQDENFRNGSLYQYESGTRCVLKHMFYQGQIRNRYCKLIELLDFVNEHTKRTTRLKHNLKDMLLITDSSLIM